MQRRIRNRFAFVVTLLLCAALPAAAQSTIDATAAGGAHMFFAGHATTGSPAIVLGRTLQNGEMDTSFVSGGLLQLPAQPGATSVQVTALTVGHYGELLLASTQGGQIVFVHLNADGSPYGSGIVTDSDPGLVVNAVYLDPYMLDAFYALGSYTGSVTGNVKTAAIVHYGHGVRDQLFGTNGMRTYNLGTPYGGEFLSYVETPSWTITAVGDTMDLYPMGNAFPIGVVAKLTSSMDRDTSFHGNGVYTFAGGYPNGAIVKAISNDGSGGFLVSPTYHSPGYPVYLLDLSSTGSVWWQQQASISTGATLNYDLAGFVPGATLQDTFNSNPTVVGTVTDMVTGRTYFGGASFGLLAGAYVRPITADDDDVLVGAYPIDTQQFVALGTRQTASGNQALRVRYWYDGTFDTDFSLGPSNTVPNPFAFIADFGGYGPAVTAWSSSARVTGVNAGTTSISVVGGQYAIGATQWQCQSATPTSAPGTVSNGQWVCVTLTTATTPSTTSTATLTVGGIQALFNATTGTTPVTVIFGKPSTPSGSSVQFTYGNGSFNATPPLSFQCQLDGAAFAACTGTSSYSGLSPGSHTFTVQAFDVWGGDPAPPSYTWTVAAPPVTTITSTPPALTNQASASFGFASSDSSATFECKLDSGSFATCVNPKGYGSLAAGSHTFSVRSRNAAGADPAPPSFTWTIDTTAPTTTISSGPLGSSSFSSATFAFTSSKPNSTFQCSLDAAAYTSCVSGVTYSVLADGSHTFKVYATDALGNVDATGATRTWTINTAPPRTTITSGPGAGSVRPVPSSNAVFTFTSTKPDATFQCSLDGAAYAACVSGQTYSNIPDGSHVMTVLATDSAGHADPLPPSLSWSIDTIGAHATITSGPPSLTNQTSATFNFTANDAQWTSESCYVDGLLVTTLCYQSYTLYSLANGTHTFKVVEMNVGGADPSPPTYTWTIDTVRPVVTITSGPSGTTTGTSASFAFTSSKPNSTFQCQLDIAAPVPCSSPVSYSALADGTHHFDAVATDAAGNVGGAEAVWTVDTTPPTTTINSGPNLVTNQTSATFYFAANDSSAALQCSLDNAAFAACTSPVSYSGLAAGNHVFKARGSDAAGNVEPNPASYAWTIDLTPPVTTVTSGPTFDTTAATAAFTFASNEPNSTFACLSSVPGDPQGFHACTSPVTFSGLVDGSYVFYVRAIDPAGNWDPNWNTYQWIVDTTAPDTSITSGPPSLTGLTSATFTFVMGDSNNFSLTSQCKLDGAAFAACTSPVTYSSLADGSHTFQVRAVDGAGNVDPTPSSLTWTVDTTPPLATITSGPSGSVASTTASFTFTSSEGSSAFACSLDNAAFASCSGPSTYSGLSQGSHTFAVKAMDAVGNTGPAASQSWTVDTVAPTAGISSGPSGSASSTSATFTYSSSESSSTFDCKIDSGSYATCAATGVTYSGLAQGSHTFSVRAHDAAGNVSNPATRTWTVDTVPPETTITGGPTGSTTATTATFTFTSTQSPATFQCSLDNAAFTSCTSPKTYSGFAKGAHTFQVRSIDAAGNVDATPASRTWTRK